MNKKDKIVINKDVNNAHEIFGLIEERAREIFNDIYYRITSLKKIKISDEIEYLYKKYNDINEFIFAVYILGHQTRAAYENKTILMQKELNMIKTFILDKYFEIEGKVH